MKLWLLKLWNKIMTNYASNQIAKLRRDFQEVYFQFGCYKAWYNILLVLFLVQNKPKVTIIHETDTEAILEILIKDTVFQLPITDYKAILQNIIKPPVSSSPKNENLVDYEENIRIFHKYMLSQVLENYQENSIVENNEQN